MKKIILCLLTSFLLSVFCTASEFSDLLDKAKSEYSNGNLSSAISFLDSARKIVDSENLKTTDADYLEISNWDVVKLKKASYIGKRVKARMKFIAINSDSTLWIGNIISCTYDEKLVDKILELQKYKEYIFCGTVEDGLLGPELHIEKIE